MLNRIILMGRLTRDPELRHTQTGTPVASFSLAVDRDFKDRNTGEKATDFIDIVAWRQTAEFVSRYFTKGRMAVVEGRLQLRDWTDRDGNKRRAAEIHIFHIIYRRKPCVGRHPKLHRADSHIGADVHIVQNKRIGQIRLSIIRAILGKAGPVRPVAALDMIR